MRIMQLDSRIYLFLPPSAYRKGREHLSVSSADPGLATAKGTHTPMTLSSSEQRWSKLFQHESHHLPSSSLAHIYSIVQYIISRFINIRQHRTSFATLSLANPDRLSCPLSSVPRHEKSCQTKADLGLDATQSSFQLMAVFLLTSKGPWYLVETLASARMSPGVLHVLRTPGLIFPTPERVGERSYSLSNPTQFFTFSVAICSRPYPVPLLLAQPLVDQAFGRLLQHAGC